MRRKSESATSALGHNTWKCGSQSLTAAEREQLVEYANAFISAAFESLAKSHVIPTSIYQPWVRVGTDYPGAIVRGEHLENLEAMLKTMYSGRFADPMTTGHPEFPSTSAFSLLEAAIRRCANVDGDAYVVDSPPVQESIEEFIKVLESPDYTMACCRAMSHLTTIDGTPVTIGDIAIIPEDQGQSLLSRTLREVIPAAGASFSGERPVLYDPVHSLLVTTVRTSDPNSFKIESELTEKIDRFLLVGRLLYAGTYESAWQVVGTSTLVSRLSPHFRTFDSIHSPPHDAARQPDMI